MKKLFCMLFFAPLLLIGQNSLERLEQSPRHHEWVTIDYGDRTLKGFLVYPEVSEKVPLIIYEPHLACASMHCQDQGLCRCHRTSHLVL